jgi:choline dehydrogenase-like flavoprotein
MTSLFYQTSYNTWYSSLIDPFTKSVTALSFKLNPNPNDGDATGLINSPRAVDIETGTRQHSGVTYLAQTAGRRNISVLIGAHATKILFSDARGELTAVAVGFDVNGTKHIVKANKEIILSAGKPYICMAIFQNQCFWSIIRYV